MITISVISSNRRRNSAAMKIVGNCEIEMHVPSGSKYEIIADFVSRSTPFLVKALTQKGRVVTKKQFVDGDSFFLLGENFSIKLAKARSNFVIIDSESRIVEIGSKNGQFIVTKELYKLLKPRLFEIVEQLAERNVEVMGVPRFARLRVKQVSSLWGSCSRSRNLTFNIKLIHYPIEVINYVVIHELGHLVHPNHSKNFWDLVLKYCENYKTLRKELKLHKFG